MKLLLLLLIPLTLFAPDKPPEKSIDVFKMWERDRVLRAIIMVESAFNPLAYNEPEQAAGLMSIRPIMLRHVNKLTGSTYQLSDRYDSLKSIAMFDSLMKYRNPEYDLKLATNLWNAGTLHPKGKTKINVEKYYRKVLLYYN